MKRHPAYDPPEYVGFKPDREVMAEYRKTLTRDPWRARFVKKLDGRALLRLYEGMVRFRLHDIALKRWVRQGILSKAWLGTGEEAVTVGAAHALGKGDVVGPMIRNAGACCAMGMPVAQMLKAYLGTGDQITRGRDLHTGDPALGVLPPTSLMGSFVPVFTGIGLAFKQRGEKRLGLTWLGDGASRTGAFHEGRRAGRLSDSQSESRCSRLLDDSVRCDTVLTTSPVSVSGEVWAMSATDMIPQHCPSSSATGARRTCFSSRTLQQSRTRMSGGTVIAGADMTSRAVKLTGFSPRATARQMISRSVTTPTGRRVLRLSTTGIWPQSHSTIISATSLSVVSTVQHAGLLVMISRTLMAFSFRARQRPPIRLLFREHDLSQDARAVRRKMQRGRS